MNGARIAYTEMVKVHMSTSDYVIDGEKGLENIINEIMEIISSL